MRIPYGFNLVNNGVLEVNENEVVNVRMIFDYYLAGASLGKVADMLYAKQIPSPTGKEKWTRAAVEHLLSNSKYIAIVGFESYASVQFEKPAAAISTMIRRVLREKKLDMSHLRCFSGRRSKGITVVVVGYLCGVHPDASDFLSRNLRRMRECRNAKQQSQS